jgi:hypothetical protein
MPVASFVLGAKAWTPVDHKPSASERLGSPPRLLPEGMLHALDPEDHTAICSGVAMVPDPAGRSFTPAAAGTCAACNERLAPSPRPVRPADEPRSSEA